MSYIPSYSGRDVGAVDDIPSYHGSDVGAVSVNAFRFLMLDLMMMISPGILGRMSELSNQITVMLSILKPQMFALPVTLLTEMLLHRADNLQLASLNLRLLVRTDTLHRAQIVPIA